jgi:hypothetical protein
MPLIVGVKLSGSEGHRRGSRQDVPTRSRRFRRSGEAHQLRLMRHLRNCVDCVPLTRPSALFNKLRFKLHGADAVDFAVDIMIALDQADVLDLGADFDNRG